MRARGQRASVAGLGAHDHVCWSYRSASEMVDAAVDFLSDAPRLGQRAVYVAERPRAELLGELEPLGDPEQLEAEGALSIQPLEGVYRAAGTLPGHELAVDPDQQLATYQQAIDEATSAGFSGIRVAVDATPLAWGLPSLAEWEVQADRLMATRPMAALCAYDAATLGPDIMIELACRHPVHNGGSPFSLGWLGDGAFVDGEVDAFGAEPLLEALQTAFDAEEVAVVDLSGLTFMDAAGAGALAGVASVAAARGAPLRVRGAPPLVRRVWDLLRYDEFAALCWAE